jgi:hypothetical protein
MNLCYAVWMRPSRNSDRPSRKTRFDQSRDESGRGRPPGGASGLGYFVLTSLLSGGARSERARWPCRPNRTTSKHSRRLPWSGRLQDCTRFLKESLKTVAVLEQLSSSLAHLLGTGGVIENRENTFSEGSWFGLH